MPIIFTLTCAQCGAHLPAVERPSTIIRCPHCGSSTVVSLSPGDLALLRDGLRTETREGDAYLLTEVGSTLLARMDVLTRIVERGDRLDNALVRIPLLEEKAAQLVDRRCDVQADADAGLKAVSDSLAAARKRRNRWLFWTALVGMSALVGDAYWFALFFALLFTWSLVTWNQVSGRLHAEMQRITAEREEALDTMQREMEECARSIDDLRAESMTPDP